MPEPETLHTDDDATLTNQAGPHAGLGLGAVAEMERVVIEHALRDHGGNVRDAAESLGMGQATLYRKLKRHGIAPKSFRRRSKSRSINGTMSSMSQ